MLEPRFPDGQNGLAKLTLAFNLTKEQGHGQRLHFECVVSGLTPYTIRMEKSYRFKYKSSGKRVSQESWYTYMCVHNQTFV